MKEGVEGVKAPKDKKRKRSNLAGEKGDRKEIRDTAEESAYGEFQPGMQGVDERKRKESPNSAEGSAGQKAREGKGKREAERENCRGGTFCGRPRETWAWEIRNWVGQRAQVGGMYCLEKIRERGEEGGITMANEISGREKTANYLRMGRR